MWILRQLVRHPRYAIRFLAEWGRYARLNSRSALRPRLAELWPVLIDYAEPAGIVDYYFHQDLWAARKIYARRPGAHVDVGSRVDGFISHLLVFMPVSYVDVRPLKGVLGLTVVQEDATTMTGFGPGTIDSLSSLNAAEHFGLGRYGDPIDPEACFTFMHSLARALKPGGRLYFATPIGRERVQFNAHRIFALETILEHFADLKLVSFSYVDAEGTMWEDVPLESYIRPDQSFACGLFEFTRE